MSEQATRGPGRPRKGPTEYRLLRGTSPGELEKKVTREMAEGWQCAGGVECRGPQWYQAIQR